MLYKLSKVYGRSHAILALMVYDWINQFKKGSNTRRPSLNREGGVSPKCTLPPPWHAMSVASLGWIESLVFSWQCVIISSLGGKIRLRCVYRSLTCGWDELHACLHPTMVHSMVHTTNVRTTMVHLTMVHTTMVHSLVHTTMVYTQLWYTQLGYTQLWYILLS